jgi:aminopeptidase N
MITKGASPNAGFLDALDKVAADDALDPAFRALVLALPSEDDMAHTLHASGVTPDPTAIYATRRALTAAIAARCETTMTALYAQMTVEGAYTPEADAAGRRALRGTALRLLAERDGGARAAEQFAAADNMTEQLGAFSTLLAIGKGEAQTQSFYEQWSGDRLVMDKWFALQVAHAAPEAAAATCKALTEHRDFDWKNPNRFRSVIGALTMNAAGFHHASGDGYRLLADWLIRLDALNPQTTARMCTAFETWRRYDTDRQALITAELDRILATPGLSRDTTEMVSRIRGV